MEHAEKVLGVTFISNDQTPEVLQPGKQPFDFPPAVSSRARAVMTRHHAAANPLLKPPVTGLERRVSVGEIRSGCASPPHPQDTV